MRSQSRHPRVQRALATRGKAVEKDFRRAGAAWPARGIFLKGYKHEGELELWAAPATGRRWVKVRTLPICAASGTLGPKREQGDLQVPEGAYVINRFNPRSRFHLSLGLNYPNRVDRARSKGIDPGNDIFIHGGCVTVGCLPMRDGPMEELYLAARFARNAGQRRIPVHISPCRFGTKGCETLTRAPRYRAHRALWKQLRAIHRAFVKTGQPPIVRDRRDGTYAIKPRGR